MGVFQEYSETQILQMIGRAGRPQVSEQESFVLLIGLNSNIESLKWISNLLYLLPPRTTHGNRFHNSLNLAAIIYYLDFI